MVEKTNQRISMGHLAHHALTHPRRWTAAGALLTLLAGFGIGRLELRTDGATLYPTGNEVVDRTRRPGLTLAALFPVLASAVLVLGGMGWLGVHLGIASSMFTALTLGVGVDFALHSVSNYSARRHEAALSHRAAIAAVWNSTGRALRWNSLILAAGFLMLANSALKPNRQLGFLLAAAMLAAYLATLVFLPGLLARLGTLPVERENMR